MEIFIVMTAKEWLKSLFHLNQKKENSNYNSYIDDEYINKMNYYPTGGEDYMSNIEDIWNQLKNNGAFVNDNQTVYTNGPFLNLDIDPSFTDWAIRENIHVVAPSAVEIQHHQPTPEDQIKELNDRIKSLEQLVKKEEGGIIKHVPDGRKLKV